MSSLLAQKKRLRNQAKARRNALLDAHPEYSSAVSARIIRLFETRFDGMNSVGLGAAPSVPNPSVATSYMAFGSEIDLHDLNRWLTQHATLLLPRLVAPSPASPKQMEFVPCEDVDHSALFSISSYGIKEPLGTAVDETLSVDVVLVPGLLFDTHGYRLGYGGGFYDRYLENRQQNQQVRPLYVGVTCEDLIVDRLPTDPHDICVDLIVTEISEYIVPIKKDL